MRPAALALTLALAVIAIAGMAGARPPVVAASSAGATADPRPLSSDPSPFPGFASPEDAVRAYVAAVASSDLDAILRVSAVDEKSTGFRLDLQVDGMGVWLPSSLGPAHDPFFAGILHERLRATQLDQVKWLAYSLLAPDRLARSLVTGDRIEADGAWARAFMAELDPGRLTDLTVVAIGLPEPGKYLTVANLAVVAESAREFGADEQTDRVALLDFEGEAFAIGFTLLRYGDGWKVSSQASVLSGLPTWGAAQPMSAEEFERLTTLR